MITIPSSDGVEVALHDLGGEGPPLVFVHATGFHGHCYARVARRLGDIRHAVAPDLRGHGDTLAPANRRFAWQGMADDLLAVIEHLHPDGPIDFVGHSMGGATVIAAELRRPGTIRRAWLFEPIVFPPRPDDHPNPMADAARRRRATFASIDAAIERYGSRPPFDALDPDILHDYVRHGVRPTADGHVALKCTPDNEADTFDSVDGTVHARLGRIDAPITIVGSGDGEPPALVAPDVAERLPNATFHRWDDATHFGPFTHPERMADEIRATIEP